MAKSESKCDFLLLLLKTLLYMLLRYFKSYCICLPYLRPFNSELHWESKVIACCFSYCPVLVFCKVVVFSCIQSPVVVLFIILFLINELWDCILSPVIPSAHSLKLHCLINWAGNFRIYDTWKGNLWHIYQQEILFFSFYKEIVKKASTRSS